MKKVISLPGIVLFMILLVSGCSQPDSGGSEKAPRYSIEQFMKTVNIRGSSFSPDESHILFSSNETGIYNCYEIPVEGGEPVQLTASEDDYAFAISYFPEDKRFLFTSDQGGNEINHIYLRDMDGSITDITPDAASKNSFWGWSYDKKSFFFQSNKRDERYFDLMEMDISSSGPDSEAGLMTATTLYENKDGYSIGAISRDKRYVSLVKSITTNNNEMYLFDRESGEILLLSPHEGDAKFDPQYFSADGAYLIYTTDEDSEFMYLKKYHLTDRESEVYEKADWDIWYSYLSRNGKYRVVAVNNDAKTEIKIYNEAEGKLVKLPEFPSGDITSVNISDSEKLMTFYVNSSTSPNNLYVYDFETGAYKKLTSTLSPEIDPEHLVAGEVIRFSSFDGLQVPAILYTPKGIVPGEKLPASLWIHGGPGGQSRLGYSAVIQYMVNHGYVVLAVNNRGSSGYGKTFYKADDKKHGDVDLKDCIESKKFLASLGYVESDKIAITGGSYGGYMVMAALAFAPDEFAAGVDIFGVTNWLRTLKSIPPWWSSFRDALYDELGNPETDSLALYNKSPLFFADDITKPFIVLQGANDPRVLQVESDEIVEAARANGVPVEYIVFDDEGHGFTKKENQIVAWEAIVKFLDKFLKEETDDPGTPAE